MNAGFILGEKTLYDAKDRIWSIRVELGDVSYSDDWNTPREVSACEFIEAIVTLRNGQQLSVSQKIAEKYIGPIEYLEFDLNEPPLI